MKILLNTIGLAGFGMLAAGLRLQCGLPVALMVSGGLMLAFSIRALGVLKRGAHA